ncbi:MAG TPA: DUF1080 domain-containing protein [Bryobacterales bacterium]|nr:DUF1080 domain-containing protein [Bryobacterales bacterium]
MKRATGLLLAAGAGLWIMLGAPSNSAPNTLTPQEKAEGWILLFDGKTLNGWISRGGGAEWRVVDGAIMTDSRRGGGLYTAQQFSDFILKAEFRTTDDVDAGMYLRIQPPEPNRMRGTDPKAKKTGERRGYELQIRDTARKGGYNTGSIIDAIQASPAHIKSNQWNTYEVTAQGDHFIIVFNGEKVAEGHDGKFSRGSIGLQWAHPERVSEGHKIEFRNLKIRPL